MVQAAKMTETSGNSNVKRKRWQNFAQIADACKKQQQMLDQQERSANAPVSTELRNATSLADLDQRKTLKFGLSPKGGTSKNIFGGATKKPKVATVASVFGNDNNDEKQNISQVASCISIMRCCIFKECLLAPNLKFLLHMMATHDFLTGSFFSILYFEVCD